MGFGRKKMGTTVVVVVLMMCFEGDILEVP